MAMKACKHLDFDESKYAPGCTLVTLEGFSVPVQHWHRNNVPYEGAPVNVQFCGKGRGRINGIFQCYNPGEMTCYEPEGGGHGESREASKLLESLKIQFEGEAMVRAKFVCNMKRDDMVFLAPVYSGSPENEQFFKATPGGDISLYVVNESAFNAFEIGKEYYVDFTPAG